MIDLPVFIPHCKKLRERKPHVIEQVSKIFSNYVIYEDFDGDELTDDIINKYYSDDFDVQLNKLKLWLPQPHKARILNRAEISLTIKHYMMMRYIANGVSDVAVALEDDVILDDDFEVKFNSYYNETPTDFDAIFMGSCWNLRPANIEPNKHVYHKNHPATKCTDSYVIKRSACEKLITTYVPFHLCVDFEIAYQMYQHDMRVYWWDPPIVKQGSESGLFASDLR
jgi:GR25 family glycosyltransferase involved in LPS biosynthesis